MSIKIKTLLRHHNHLFICCGGIFMCSEENMIRPRLATLEAPGFRREDRKIAVGAEPGRVSLRRLQLATFGARRFRRKYEEVAGGTKPVIRSLSLHIVFLSDL